MKKIISIIGILVIILVIIYTINQNSPEEAIQTSQSEHQVTPSDETLTDSEVITDRPDIDYSLFRGNVLNAGPPKDGIPPIDRPIYISLEEADDLLKDDDQVFVYETENQVYVYPQSILVWHEIVNDEIDGQSLAITYCPLTGSTICYVNLPNNTFGTSGNLLNSNLVMYDRLTESYIPQILGIGINDDLIGQRLETKPIHWSTWQHVKNEFDQALVLSSETGFFRDYESDPYGSYTDDTSYYLSGEIIFPVIFENDQYQDKLRVVGVKHGEKTTSLMIQSIKDEGLKAFTLDDEHFIAFYDYKLETVRVFLNPDQIDFSYSNGKILDSDKNVWSHYGHSGDLSLESATYFDVMWFAWYAFYPSTEVVE